MKTLKEIKEARHSLCEHAQTRGISTHQIALLSGMINALVWASGEAHCDAIKDLLAGRPLATTDPPVERPVEQEEFEEECDE